MIPIVFKYEEEAGLAEAIRSDGSISYASSIQPINISKDQKKHIKKLLESQGQANPNQFDLFYLESILASVGWNNNDDVFDAKEVWTARNTPVDKQFNYMHDESDIIGHLTSSKIVATDGSVVDDDTDFEELPSQFDIVVGSVLYRTWSDEKRQERMDQIIDDILEGKWFVSMECLFRNFDYAIITPDGYNKVLARNDDTSFLTKHLRVYGGTGEFDGNKIGRLLRNFTFSGKGLVDNPANPKSYITKTDDYKEVSSFAGSLTTADELNISNEEKFMSNVSQEQYDALKAELDQLKSSQAEEVENQIKSLKDEINALAEAKETVDNELSASKEVATAKDETIAKLEKEVEELKSQLAEAKKTIQEKEEAEKCAKRKAALLEKVEEEKADNLVEKFSNASDEMFDALVESLPAKKMYKEDEEDEEKNKKSKSSEEDGDEIETDLDDTNASDDDNLPDGGDDDQDISSKAASWFINNVLKSTANKKGEQ